MKPDKISTFHLLAFPKDKDIKSIRDLKADHIPLLKNMVKKITILKKMKLKHIFIILRQFYWLIIENLENLL